MVTLMMMEVVMMTAHSGRSPDPRLIQTINEKKMTHTLFTNQCPKLTPDSQTQLFVFVSSFPLLFFLPSSFSVCFLKSSSFLFFFFLIFFNIFLGVLTLLCVSSGFDLDSCTRATNNSPHLHARSSVSTRHGELTRSSTVTERRGDEEPLHKSA